MSVYARLKKRMYFATARYFRHFANRAFKRWQPRVIAITGSVGKTTMLNLVEHQLGAEAHYSHDANSAFGIAFDLVGLRGVTGSKLRWIYLFVAVPIKSLFYKHTEPFYIVEIDGERPHETEFLAEWLKPEVTVWVSLGRSHAIQFEKQVAAGEFENIDEAITHEFAMLPEHTSKMILVDGDVELMVRACEKVKKHHHITAKIVKCSKSALKGYKVYPDHTDFTLKGEGKRLQTTFRFYNPKPRSLAIQLTMLEKLCDYLEVPLKTDLKGMRVPPGRSSYFEGVRGLQLIDSSYNAHRISVESILEMAKELKSKHKWLVLGDMVEQGKIEGEEHAKLACAIIDVEPEQVVLVGRRLHEYTYPLLVQAGVAAYSTENTQEALEFIEKNAKGGETIVFKGSQYLEWIIEKLLKNPADASRLPRREKAAVKRREKRGLK